MIDWKRLKEAFEREAVSRPSGKVTLESLASVAGYMAEEEREVAAPMVNGPNVDYTVRVIDERRPCNPVVAASVRVFEGRTAALVCSDRDADSTVAALVLQTVLDEMKPKPAAPSQRWLICCGDDEYMVAIAADNKVTVLASSDRRGGLQVPSVPETQRAKLSEARCIDVFGDDWSFNDVWERIEKEGVIYALAPLT
jgi:hypothetical protein